MKCVCLDLSVLLPALGRLVSVSTSPYFTSIIRSYVRWLSLWFAIRLVRFFWPVFYCSLYHGVLHPTSFSVSNSLSGLSCSAQLCGCSNSPFSLAVSHWKCSVRYTSGRTSIKWANGMPDRCIAPSSESISCVNFQYLVRQFAWWIAVTVKIGSNRALKCSPTLNSENTQLELRLVAQPGKRNVKALALTILKNELLNCRKLHSSVAIANCYGRLMKSSSVVKVPNEASDSKTCLFFIQ